MSAEWSHRMSDQTADLSSLLRSIRAFDGPLPSFDPGSVPDDPSDLFASWLSAAVRAGLPQPNAMVLSTVDDLGRPDARVVILRSVDAAGWWFASTALGPKGAQLTSTPWAALTWYWPQQGRQIRARGWVRAADGASDFLARSPAGRAEAVLAARGSQPLASIDELGAALAAAEESDQVPAGWTRYQVLPTEVQFFQIDPSRKHIRVRYELTDNTWSRSLIWP
jgi:pyridoxamine 5'-phosphate oxidase